MGRRLCFEALADIPEIRPGDVLAPSIVAALAANECALGSGSFGRPWRNGVVNVALGSAGIPALIDRRGDTDRHGRTLQITQTAFADAVAAGAAVVTGEGDEGMPVMVASGFMPAAPETDCRALVRPIDTDLFQ